MCASYGQFEKWPKTLHFSWSPNLSKGDKRLPNDNIFVGKTIVVTEKLDGECTGMTRGSCHARSLDGRDHPSRHWVKGLHAAIAQSIPDDFHLFGENLFAKHSIAYNQLPSFFFMFGMVDEHKICLSWHDTVEWSELLEIPMPTVLYYGPWNQDIVKACYTGVSPWGDAQEGYVVRNADAFPMIDFQTNVAKCVRYKHVQTGGFWMKNWTPNHLAKEDR